MSTVMTQSAIAKFLKQVPTKDLLKAAQTRKQEVREEQGKYATQKVKEECIGCKETFGVRELLKHKKMCEKFLEGRKQSMLASGRKRPSPEWSFRIRNKYK